MVNNPQYISIGRGVHIRPYVRLDATDCYRKAETQTFDPNLSIGDYSYLGMFVCIECNCEVVIGRYVLISQRVCITDHGHQFSDPNVPIMQQPLTENRRIVIGDGSFIGHGAIILPAVSIGANSVIKHYDFNSAEWITC